MKLIYMHHTIQYIESEAKLGNIMAVNKITEINNFDYNVIQKEKYIIFTEK